MAKATAACGGCGRAIGSRENWHSIVLSRDGDREVVSVPGLDVDLCARCAHVMRLVAAWALSMLGEPGGHDAIASGLEAVDAAGDRFDRETRGRS